MHGIFTLRNLTDADNLIKFMAEKKPRKAVIVGAGFIGLEMAENLKIRGLDVTVVEMLDQVLAPLDLEMAAKVTETLENNGVEVLLSSAVTGFKESEEGIIVEITGDRKISCDMVLLSIGVKPDLELVKKAGLNTGERGGIRVNEYMQTSDPDIYAVGDAVETRNKVTGQMMLAQLAGPANRQARIAVDNIFGRRVAYKGTLGTALVRLFDITAGVAGPNEKTLAGLDIPYRKCYLHPYSHADYYPGGAIMIVKILFSPNDGRVLGAQITGNDGVDKRIDVFATAIQAGMTVDDLTHLELGYVPQYGSAKDAVNMSGYVASNIINGDAPTTHWSDVNLNGKAEKIVLDVRSHAEFVMGAVSGAKHIPIDELRGRISELPADIPVNLYCDAGVRSYIATRILKQKCYDVRNISGGFRVYDNEPEG